jgi:hypothetical protein
MAVLAYCKIPSAANIPTIRTLIVALEGIFTALFWALVPSEKTFGLSHLCPLDPDTFEWIGLGSHSPLREGIRGLTGEMDYTPEELEYMAKLTKEKNAEYQYHYQRELRANPTEHYKQRQAAHNIKQKPGTRARQKAAVEEKKYHCNVCDVSYRDAASLRRHNATPRHKRKLEHGTDSYKCLPCNASFRYLSGFEQHKLAKSHLSKVKNTQ